jgi:hypothetical protein
MQTSGQIAKLEESVKVYEEVIRSFEAANDHLRRRRHGALDAVMVEIDRSLELNQRTLDSLNRVVATVKAQLEQERARS